MIPAGRERDKKIAELLGWLHYEDYLPGASYDNPKNGLINTETTEVRKWSTNRNDAFELWDIMKKECDIYFNVNENAEYEILLDVDLPITPISYLGKDEADAISGAFIKYKEATDGT
jgi:hypothetical protein